jgi:signal transduction histidine kinase
MSENGITVLLVEDNPGDARLIREILEEETSSRFNLVHATQLETGLERLAQGDIDVALVDLALPDSQGIDTFNQVHAHSPDVPIVVLTGLKDDAVAAQVLRAGAQDFLTKGLLNLSVMHRSIQHAIDRKQAEGSHDAKHVVAAVNRAHDQFLAALSDELRAPLTLVLSTVSTLMDESTTSADRLAHLATIRQHVEREGRLLDDILAYSRVGTGGAAFQTTDCEAVVERALANLKAAIDETAAVVTRGPLPSLWADAAQLVQLFQILIGNAIKYGGQGPPRIHLAAERQSQKWIVSIRDHGIGFDPKHAERIFTIFPRLHDGDERLGTGIGLAICKKIVDRHAGRIWAESEPGRGSRFCFTIPARANGEP